MPDAEAAVDGSIDLLHHASKTGSLSLSLSLSISLSLSLSVD